MNSAVANSVLTDRPFHLLINGRAVSGATSLPVINPATEQVLAVCARADSAQLHAAVQAAKAAFAAWSAVPLETRRAKLLAIADACEQRSEELARLLTAEQGKPLAHARGEVAGSIFFIRALASFEMKPKVVAEDAGGRFVEHRAPLGVVAAITPWNFPISLITVKAVPALLAGNTLVAKPAPTTPLTTLRYLEIFNEFLPPGACNVIVDNNDLGSELTAHPDVAKISFTGSSATGKKVMASAAATLKRVTLELGGNDAAIVLDDVEPKTAAQRLFDGAMVNSGQVCLAIKRAYVPERHYDAICEELARLADAAKVGDGMQPDTEFGPIQNKMQFERVKSLIDDARRVGKIVAGGETFGPGYFVRPTIVRDLPDDARLV
ncbi:MAG: aldehyde dehydrogenase family protein, partial [Steroidobacteraceae bacterium]|nr:aldehyde dehydrogenase family protein [Steroidobacteraceae bacterium]